MYRLAKIFVLSLVFILMMTPSVAFADIVVSSVTVDPERIGGDETALVTINIAGTLCPAGATAIDAMMVVDRSGSMVEPASKINAAVDSAISFVGRANSAVDRIGVSSFNDTGTLDIGLTSDFGAVEGVLNELRSRPIGFTAIAEGTRLGVDEILRSSSDRLPLMIILSDGVDFPTSSNFEPEIARACGAGVQVFTIGLGAPANIDVPRLTSATCNGGFYSQAEQPADLAGIYDQIASSIRSYAARDVTISDLIPAGVEVVQGSINNGGTVSGGGVSWNLTEIDGNISLSYEVTSNVGEFESGRIVDIGTGSISYEGCSGAILNASVPLRPLTINHCPECQCELVNSIPLLSEAEAANFNTAVQPARLPNPSQGGR